MLAILSFNVRCVEKKDSTTASADNASTSQDHQDGDRAVAGLKDMALNNVNEDQGSDDSDSDEEIVADQSFPGKTIKTGYTNILA